MEVIINELERRLEVCENSIRDLEQHQTDYAVEQAKINTQLSNALVTLGEIKFAIEQIKEKPAKRWDSIVATIISVVVTAFVTYLLTR